MSDEDQLTVSVTADVIEACISGDFETVPLLVKCAVLGGKRMMADECSQRLRALMGQSEC